MSAAPVHVAIIMDGNGRWARRRALPRVVGHRRGVDRIRPVAVACAERGVRYLTLYAFSTENWKRPRAEVTALLGLLSDMIDSEAQTCLRDNIRLRLVGSLERLDDRLAGKVRDAIDLNRNNTGLTLCLAFDYGSHSEITKAARALVEESTAPDAVDEVRFSRHLYTAGMPDVDLLIRCGGEQRLSNFLMWQSAYAELYFTDTLWPEFGERELDAALEEFARRNRRYGGQHSGGET
ncbi:MAG: polyprenyl diphosphate synthase [Chloroflexota bacterium]